MKLYEAIRVGSQGKQQAFGLFFEPSTGAICALTAAVSALDPGVPIVAPTGDIGFAAMNVLDRIAQASPDGYGALMSDADDSCGCLADDECEGPAAPGFDMLVAHMNDEHHWTFEQIARWLETYDL